MIFEYNPLRYMKIGFISSASPTDRRASSGTNYQMAQALAKVGELVWIPIAPPRYYRYLEIGIKALARLCRKNICFNYMYIGAKILASNIDAEKFLDCDIIVAFWAGSVLAFVDTKGKPVVYLSDATFPAMIDYYPPFSHLFKKNIRFGIDIEKHSLNKATQIVLSSDWSAASAINDLQQPEKKVHVIEFGANIDDKDILPHSFVYNGHLDILFMGVEWKRKGGDIAVEAIRWLNANGIDATLHIIGIKRLDEKIASLPYINNVGFLNKNNPEEYRKLADIITKSHLLLLPTIAECAGIVFCEASANGLPIFTHYTGGVPNYIENGRNGYMLPLGSTGADFGKKIKECLLSGELERMSKYAVDVYREKLNWQVWAKKMQKVIVSNFK